jgi:hypothetical protein
MEDIQKFERFYFVIKFIWSIIYSVALIVALMIVLIKAENFGIGLLIAICSSAIWYALMFVIDLERIIMTRFIAMTENILEITEMLEKKSEEENN